MICKIHLSRNPYFPALFILLLGALLPHALAAGQLPSKAREQINQQVALLTIQPAKVVVKTTSEDVKVGTKSQAQIIIMNANDQPIAAREDWPCEVSVRFASGKTTTQSVTIKKGESAATFEFSANEIGLTAISVRPPVEGVRSDKTQIVIRPAGRTSRRTRPAPGMSNLWPRRDSPARLCRTGGVHAQFQLASFHWNEEAADPDQGGDNPVSPPSAAPVLHISANNLEGNFIANGKDGAVISVFFESLDLSPAPADIHLWFHWTGGALNPGQPITINKGAFSAETHLTSEWPADVHLNFVSSTPAYTAQGDTDFTVHFVPAGVTLLGPEKLSVVDNTPVSIVFFDAHGAPVAPRKSWDVSLRSRNSKLRFAPQSFQVQPTSAISSAVLFPVSLGGDAIEAIIPNYKTQPLTIVITGWLVLGLCLGGGLAGGLLAYNKFKDSWVWRIFIGIVVGAAFCWMYVYLGLPNIDVNLAHNTLSVFFVSLIGGYLGIAGLDALAKSRGWISS